LIASFADIRVLIIVVGFSRISADSFGLALVLLKRIACCRFKKYLSALLCIFLYSDDVDVEVFAATVEEWKKKPPSVQQTFRNDAADKWRRGVPLVFYVEKVYAAARRQNVYPLSSSNVLPFTLAATSA